MFDYTGGGETAEEHLKQLYETRRLNGVNLSFEEIGHSPWGEPNGSGYFSIPDGSQKFGVTLVMMDIDDWLDLQFSATEMPSHKFELWLNEAYGPTIEWVATQINNGTPEEIPTPVLEIDYDEYSVNSQEGRSRAVGAQEAGLDQLPVWIVAQEYR